VSIGRVFRPVDYIKISIFGAALSVLWPCLHTIIIPLRILEFAPEAQKNTYLGLMTFAGSLIAVFIQPLAGALSDRFGSSLGRRRPFILVGTLLALLFLPGIGFSGSFPFQHRTGTVSGVYSRPGAERVPGDSVGGKKPG
jgi:MFS family permease